MENPLRVTLSNTTRRILYAFIALATANFLAFVVIAGLIGGDAWNGKTDGSHFFVANHGKLTEVSEATFRYSLWHVRSIFVTSPILIIACLLLNGRRDKRGGATTNPPQSSN